MAISDEAEQLISKLRSEGLSVQEIARRVNVKYITVYARTRLRERVNPETGKTFESVKEYNDYLGRRRQQYPKDQVPSKQSTQEQRDLESSLIAALSNLEGIKSLTSIGYNDFAALFVLAIGYKWGGPVFPADISGALNASIFTPSDARLPPQGLAPYFEKLKQLGLIQGTAETGYTMRRELAKIISDDFNLFVTPRLSKDRFWNSVAGYYHFD